MAVRADRRPRDLRPPQEPCLVDRCRGALRGVECGSPVRSPGVRGHIVDSIVPGRSPGVGGHRPAAQQLAMCDGDSQRQQRSPIVADEVDRRREFPQPLQQPGLPGSLPVETGGQRGAETGQGERDRGLAEPAAQVVSHSGGLGYPVHEHDGHDGRTRVSFSRTSPRRRYRKACIGSPPRRGVLALRVGPRGPAVK